MCELMLDCSITKLSPVALRVFQLDRLFLLIHLYKHTAYGWNLCKLFFQLKCQGWQTVFSVSLTEWKVPQQAISCPHFYPQRMFSSLGVSEKWALCLPVFALGQAQLSLRSEGPVILFGSLRRVTADCSPFPGLEKIHGTLGCLFNSRQINLPDAWSGKEKKQAVKKKMRLKNWKTDMSIKVQPQTSKKSWAGNKSQQKGLRSTWCMQNHMKSFEAIKRKEWKG